MYSYLLFASFAHVHIKPVYDPWLYCELLKFCMCPQLTNSNSSRVGMERLPVTKVAKLDGSYY